MAMQIHDFADLYQKKADDELAQLAVESRQLTPEAYIALKAELSRRRLEVVALPEQHEQREPMLRLPRTFADLHSVNDFVAEVLRVYHGNFWLFVGLTLPAVVIGYVAILTARREVWELTRSFAVDLNLPAHRTEILEIAVVNLTGYFTSWLAFCFSFGALCFAVRQITAEVVPSVSHCFADVRSRTFSLLRLSGLLFALVVLTQGVAMLVVFGLYLLPGNLRPGGFAISLVSYCVLALSYLVMSRFGLAIPALVLDDRRVAQAMFRSDELTTGKWPILAALLTKSLVGGYIAGMAPYWLAQLYMGRSQWPSWSSWFLNAASIAGVTAVEPTMFIGFALLYVKMSALTPVPNEQFAINPEPQVSHS